MKPPIPTVGCVRTARTRFLFKWSQSLRITWKSAGYFDPAHNILSDNNSPNIPDNRLKTYNGTTYYYDHFGNLIHRELTDDEVQNYFYDLHDQPVKAEILKKDGTKETWVYSYEPLAQVHNRTNGEVENRQQTHYFHCDQIGIPHEMTDKDGNLVWFGNYTG